MDPFGWLMMYDGCINPAGSSYFYGSKNRGWIHAFTLILARTRTHTRIVTPAIAAHAPHAPSNFFLLCLSSPILSLSYPHTFSLSRRLLSLSSVLSHPITITLFFVLSLWSVSQSAAQIPPHSRNTHAPILHALS